MNWMANHFRAVVYAMPYLEREEKRERTKQTPYIHTYKHEVNNPAPKTRNNNKVTKARLRMLVGPAAQELVEVGARGDAEHKATVRVGDDGKLLVGKEGLQVLQWRPGRDERVALDTAPVEPAHHCADRRVTRAGSACHRPLQLRGRHVAQQRTRGRMHDRQLAVVAVVRHGLRRADRRVWRDGERRRQVQVFDSCLRRFSLLCTREKKRERTPRNLEGG